MVKSILGKKVGMTQIFDEQGRVVPVTVIEAGPCVVTQKKTLERDGYEAVQLGLVEAVKGAGTPVTALIQAPEERADAFDPLGLVLPARWEAAELPLDDGNCGHRVGARRRLELDRAVDAAIPDADDVVVFAQARAERAAAPNVAVARSADEIEDGRGGCLFRGALPHDLGPGQSASLDWRVNAILDGDYMVYMVAIPAPGSPEATSQPVASSGIHLTVTPYTKLNPGGVLPYAIGGPVLLVVVIFFVYRHRRKQIDAGGS